MSSLSRIVVFIAVAAGIALFWGCENSPHPIAEVVYKDGLPQNVLQCCTIPTETLSTWFEGGKYTPNVYVSPANSVTLVHDTNCNFYQYGERMFMWITSPMKSSDPSAGRIFQTGTFYQVSPPENGSRTLTQNGPAVLMNASGHVNKTGPNKLPVIIDTRGRLYEVENHVKGYKPTLLLTANGNTTELDHVEERADGGYVFKDKAGNVIAHPKPKIEHKINSTRIVHEYRLGNKHIYLDGNGDEVKTSVQSEEGQATGGALMAQNGSLVYYILMVNDVYAYYVSACNSKTYKMSNYQFPTTAGARDSICTFARNTYAATLPDSNALAIELKTSWVEVNSQLAHPETYITMDAYVPNYDTTSKTMWVPKGKPRKTTLALIGMHIVGSINNHPEMVWASFEHKNNAPNAAYQYVDSTGKTDTVPQQTGNGWLLSSNAADPGPNTPHIVLLDSNTVTGDTLLGDYGYPISPSNTLRSMPWGSAWDSVTNPEDKSSARSNSEIISINNIFQNMLDNSDLRKNYLLIGATWTNDGTAPNGSSYHSGIASGQDVGYAIGTSVLANSSMETYIQFPSTSCFTCHNGGNSLSPDQLSHIFGEIQSLPVVPKTIKK